MGFAAAAGHTPHHLLEERDVAATPRPRNDPKLASTNATVAFLEQQCMMSSTQTAFAGAPPPLPENVNIVGAALPEQG